MQQHGRKIVGLCAVLDFLTNSTEVKYIEVNSSSGLNFPKWRNAFLHIIFSEISIENQ